MKKIILLLSAFLFGNWLLDVGSVAYFLWGDNAYLSNGIWFVSAQLAYHLGWYLSIISFFVLLFFYEKEKRKNQKKLEK